MPGASSFSGPRKILFEGLSVSYNHQHRASTEKQIILTRWKVKKVMSQKKLCGGVRESITKGCNVSIENKLYYRSGKERRSYAKKTVWIVLVKV